jgi:hypothetical protein
VYPSLADQILGVNRVLKEIIRPSLNNDYAKDVLRWSVVTLNAVARDINSLHADQLWEVGALKSLLERVLEHLRSEAGSRLHSSDLVDCIRDQLEGAPAATSDTAALEAELGKLREMAAALAREFAFKKDAEFVTAELGGYVAALCNRMQ